MKQSNKTSNESIDAFSKPREISLSAGAVWEGSESSVF